DRDGRGAHAAAADVDVGPVLPRRRRDLERLADDHARRLAAEVLVRRTRVDGNPTVTGAQPDARDGGLALAGPGEDVALCAHRCRRSSGEWHGPLRPVWMIGPGVDLQLGREPASEAVLREHPLDGLADHAGGLLGEHFLRARPLDAAGIAGVADVGLVGEFVAGESDTLRV